MQYDGGQKQADEFLKALKERNKGPARNAGISLEEPYIKWLDHYADQAGIGRAQVVRHLIEEKMTSFEPTHTVGSTSTDVPLKTTITLHPAIAKAVRHAGGNLNEVINQALAQAFELEVPV